MKKILIKACLASAVMVLATTPSAFALITEGSVRANIPFKFYAGDVLLPAGHYTITVPNSQAPDILLFRNSNDTAEAIVMTDPAFRLDPAHDVRLDFDKVANKDFLSSIWVEGTRTGYELMKPPLENKLEAQTLKSQKQFPQAHPPTS